MRRLGLSPPAPFLFSCSRAQTFSGGILRAGYTVANGVLGYIPNSLSLSVPLVRVCERVNNVYRESCLNRVF